MAIGKISQNDSVPEIVCPRTVFESDGRAVVFKKSMIINFAHHRSMENQNSEWVVTAAGLDVSVHAIEATRQEARQAFVEVLVRKFYELYDLNPNETHLMNMAVLLKFWELMAAHRVTGSQPAPDKSPEAQ